MNNQLSIPNIEKLKVETATIKLSAKMTLAMIPVTVSGQYNIDSNCYYPSSVRVHSEVEIDNITNDFSYDLEEFCAIMSWDYFDTHDAIQEAVEKRDQ